MSALTSLLARDQAVPVRKIEEALQRQVVMGGELGTSLLECDALPENVLAAYQAALFNVLPATRDEVMRAPRDTIRLVPRELAEKHRIMPLAIDGRALIVAASEPLAKEVESQLGFLLGYEIVVRAVCDVRISAALLHHYGVEAPLKHRRLIETLRHREAGPVPYVAPPDVALMEENARARLVKKSSASAWLDELDEPDADPEPAPPPPPARASMPPPVSEGRTTDPLGIPSSKVHELLGEFASEERASDEAARNFRPETIPSPPPLGGSEPEFDGSDTMPYGLPSAESVRVFAVAGAPPSAASMPSAEVSRSSAGHELAVNPTVGVGVRRSQPPAPQRTPTPAPLPAEVLPRSSPIVEIAEPAAKERPRSSWKVRGPLSASEGVRLLSESSTRDEIVGVFFGFSRQFFDYSALFAVTSDRADGIDAYGDGASLATVRGHSFSLEESSRPSRLVLARRALQPQLGRASTEEDHAFLRTLERPLNTFTIVQPVVLRGRAVLLFVGDRGGEPFTVSDIPEFVGFVPRVVDALEKLILRKKREGAAPKEPAPKEPAPSVRPPRKSDRWAISTPTPAEGFPSEPPRSPSLLDAIAATGIADLRHELDAIAARGADEAPDETRPVASLPPEQVAVGAIAEMSSGVHASHPASTAPASTAPASTAPASTAPASTAPASTAPASSVATELPAVPVDAAAPDDELDMGRATIPMPEPVLPQRSDSSASRSVEALRRLPRRSPTMREVLGIPRAAPPPPTSSDDLFETPSETGNAETASIETTGFEKASSGVDGERSADGASSDQPDLSPKTIPAPPPLEDDEPELVIGSLDGASDDDDGDYDDASDDDEDPIRSAPTEPGKRMEALIRDRAERRRPETATEKLPRRDPRREDDGPVQYDVVRTRSVRPPPASGSASVIVDGLLHERPTHDREVPSVIVDMGDNVRTLVDDLALTSPDGEAPSLDLLLRLGEQALPVLTQAFPGPLWFDRRGSHRKLPRGRDVSGIARGIVAFRDRAAPYVHALLGATVPDRRFYALLVASEIPSGVLVDGIANLAFDADAGIRSLAIETLPKFAEFPEFGTQLIVIRRTARIRGKDPERRLQAIALLAALRDAESLQTLTELLEDDDVAVRRASHGALVAITCEDLGDSSRRWSAWVDRHHKEHRVEWLIEALTGSDDHLRARAGEELKSLTQQYFGYHSGASRREREVVQAKYRSWWESQGRSLFRS